MDVKLTGRYGMELIHTSKDMGNKYCEQDNEFQISITCGKFLGQLMNSYDSK
jgi:hypothetical protein